MLCKTTEQFPKSHDIFHVSLWSCGWSLKEATVPWDVAASTDGSLFKDVEGSDVGFHTVRQVNLADVSTSPTKVGVSTFCHRSGKYLLARNSDEIFTLLQPYPRMFFDCFLFFFRQNKIVPHRKKCASSHWWVGQINVPFVVMSVFRDSKPFICKCENVSFPVGTRKGNRQLSL